MNKLACALVALCLSAPAVSSQASTYLVTFDRTAPGPLAATGPDAALLYLYVSDVLNGAGAYDILAITGGNVDGDAVTGLSTDPNASHPNADLSVDGRFIFDQNLFPGDPTFSNPGLLFRTATVEYNLFSTSPLTVPTTYDLLAYAGGGSYSADSLGTVSITAVPEPAAWALMIGGFGVAGGVLRRRKALAAA